ncbi:HlyD family secretion protein [Zunongwangia sp. HGR-M22]|uniref:HlyD family secretion protein n=1 Tax=Zunongwangia sp. HGR-M22 TaxID=3015168 RepID=UPI0022DD2FF6|nr:HlyD family efflux transporter periplasmic adaptor subunit [Zunongwangia sp. HGR-M22]WBL24638.1 HlyD family efflux transporter periplasmic adaptor subunit [Zunongwangia sp. HGR-M22]
MINLSNTKLGGKVKFEDFNAFSLIVKRSHHKLLSRILLGTFVFLLILLFFPWTQTISSKGYVTTLKPDQRPQTLQSPIPGQIQKWYVQEGDFVKKGDTILHITEVKNEYFDPLLVERTGNQLTSKSGSLESYGQKIEALQRQMQAIQRERELKLEQTRNKRKQADLKINSDSISLEAAKVNLSIAERQYKRTAELYEEGLKSRLDLETKQSKFQESQAKVIDLENKLLSSKNQLLNAIMEVNRIEANYIDKINKIEGEISTANSSRFDAEAQVSKLENSLSNYQIRKNLLYIRAPQDGYINRALKQGIGETFKEGEKLVTIMPSNIDIAVETYVEPIDLPLLNIGDHVRVQFDGWPAIVFSGWPNASFGTYGAKVVAIENFISDNGKYRILLTPDLKERDKHQWPEALRVGSGARTLALLEDVPIWYELWRKLNGFPPNYYTSAEKQTDGKKSDSKDSKK